MSPSGKWKYFHYAKIWKINITICILPNCKGCLKCDICVTSNDDFQTHCSLRYDNLKCGFWPRNFQPRDVPFKILFTLYFKSRLMLIYIFQCTWYSRRFDYSAWRHQVITWANIDSPSVRSWSINLITISQEIPQSSITKMSLKITYVNYFQISQETTYYAKMVTLNITKAVLQKRMI